ncbi:VOC family protein [Tessaracoccus antarcticus]|uniref:VOC family protein n=1 Tax=Tessaracoccus antarcticus TaxID=2479848 RepID=A0A3M0GC56_9ACTN|nr:VOC family protein [Tessaracoccus antarcticus]RMB60202.1 VOC family protein [Tessaracoccus antarcticus]
MPSFAGIDHIALSVTDLEVSLDFYERVLGVQSDGGMTDGPFTRRVLPLPDGSHLGLTQHHPGSGHPFDPTNPGLDHLGFSCGSRDALSQWVDHLDALGVVHSGVQDAEYGSALSFKDPDGNALEFFAPV